MAVDLGHVAGPFLELENNLSGKVIAGDQVTANVTAQVPSGAYAHIMEEGVSLEGFHTWDGQSAERIELCDGRAHLHDRVIYTKISIRRAQITIYLCRG